MKSFFQALSLFWYGNNQGSRGEVCAKTPQLDYNLSYESAPRYRILYKSLLQATTLLHTYVHVWVANITNTSIAKGFCCLIEFIDWPSQTVLS